MRRPIVLTVCLLLFAAPIGWANPAGAAPRDTSKTREQIRAEQAEVAAQLDVLNADQAEVEQAMDVLDGNVAAQLSLDSDLIAELADTIAPRQEG